MKKIVLVLVSFSLIFSFLNGAKKKKKNINKYIFGCFDTLVVFDGEKKEVQRKKFNSLRMGINYFPKHQKIVVRTHTSSVTVGSRMYDGNIYIVSSTNLSQVRKISLERLKREEKKGNTLNGVGKLNENTVSFTYGNADEAGRQETVEKFYQYVSPYNLNVVTGKYKKASYEQYKTRIIDKYRARQFRLRQIGGDWDRQIGRYKPKKKKKNKKINRFDKLSNKFKKLVKKKKINVGNYSKSGDLRIQPTGGRYMVVMNDNNNNVYLVHMKGKEVYLLLENVTRSETGYNKLYGKFTRKIPISSFIIEKNEDDVDLDKE